MPRRSLLGNSRGLSLSRSDRPGSSLPSRRLSGRMCLFNKSWLGMGKSGLAGRLRFRSSKELLGGSLRAGMGGRVFAASFSLNRSRFNSMSDLRDSFAICAGDPEGLVSTGAAVGAVAVAVFSSAAADVVLASSTSPSSTSVVAEGFGVDTPRELG